jgi:hypothetical protein
MSTPNDSASSNRTANVSVTVPRPPWLDEQLYPFQSRFVEVEGNRIHYLDEGPPFGSLRAYWNAAILLVA